MFAETLLSVTPRVLQVVCTQSGRWTGYLVRHNDVERGRYGFEVVIQDLRTGVETHRIAGGQLSQLQVAGARDAVSWIDAAGSEPMLRTLDLASVGIIHERALPPATVQYGWDAAGRRIVIQCAEEAGAAAPNGFHRTTELEYLTADGAYRSTASTSCWILDVATGVHAEHALPFEGVADVGWLNGSDDLLFSAPDQAGLGDGKAVRDLYHWSIADGTFKRISSGTLDLFSATSSADGHSVLSLGVALSDTGHSLGYASVGVYRTPLSEEGPTRLTPIDLSVSYSSQTFVETANAVLFAYDDGGAVPIGAVPLSGGTSKRVDLGLDRAQINSFAASQDGSVVVAVVTTANTAGDVLVRAEAGSSWLSSFGAALTAQLGVAEYQEISAEDADGFRVDGWLIQPDGPGPHPLVLLIKGGPYTQFGYAMSGHASFEEARYLRAAGFAVAMCNPRGSSGRGQEFAESLGGAVAENTERSLMAFLDACLRVGSIDQSRMALFGGSFGGYMVAWLMSRGLGFVAGIAERGCYDLRLHRAASPGGTNLVAALWGTDEEDLVRQSPITHVSSFSGSLMVLHSDRDGHAPFVDAQAYRYALALAGQDVEFCIAVNGDHELSRSGPVGQRLSRMDMITRWLADRIGSTH